MILVQRDPFVDGVMLSDTKSPQRRPLRFTAREWTDFAAAVINGDYGGLLRDGPLGPSRTGDNDDKAGDRSASGRCG